MWHVQYTTYVGSGSCLEQIPLGITDKNAEPEALQKAILKVVREKKFGKYSIKNPKLAWIADILDGLIQNQL